MRNCANAKVREWKKGKTHGEEILLCLSTSFLHVPCSMLYAVRVKHESSRYNFSFCRKKQKISCSSRSVNGIMSLTERLLHLGCLPVRTHLSA